MNQQPKVEETLAPESSLGAAYYPGKEAWKQEPGHRYTPDELRQMQAGWDIRIFNPDRTRCFSAD
jgi:hypothetical protein